MPRTTILITAGEASGDRLGAALMAELQAQHSNLRFIGVGGEAMAKQGLVSAFPMSDLAVMGLFEVVPAIPRILGRIKQLTQLAQAEKPSLIITIDAQDFSSRLAKALRSKAPTPDTRHPTPHIHYVAPKVWAWRQGRAAKLKNLYTHLLTILPFEKHFFFKYGMESTYVGHPAVTTLAPYTRQPSAQPTLALLPGSRSSELKRHWPVFLQTYRNLKQRQPELTAVLALSNENALHTCQALAGWTDADAIQPVYGEARFGALANATAALTKSGTNNLELALLGVPAIVTYRMNPLTYLLAKWLVKVPYISLPNLILHKAGKRVAYPEFLQRAANATKLTEVMHLLLTGDAAKEAQAKALTKLKTLLVTPQPPAKMAAEVVYKYLNKN